MALSHPGVRDQRTGEPAQSRHTAACGSSDHEVECCSTPSTLWNKQLMCTKNPGHFDFIPVKEFGIGHLPMECRDARVVSYLKTVSNLAVRVVVKHTSAERPAYYPFANLRRSDLLRLASGSAWLPGGLQELECPIPDCPYDRGSHSVYGNIRVLTNKHVVYDQAEALKTEVQFFYDSNYHPSNMFTAQCVGFDYSLEDNDRAHLRCVTHDPDLCYMLKEYVDEATAVYASIPSDVWRSCRDLCAVIGHPHGMPKTISIGKHVRYEVTMSDSHAHYHTGPTCLGSSGSPVYYACQTETGNHSMWVPATHSFHCLDTRLNCAFR